jgi:hypothetical protein
MSTGRFGTRLLTGRQRLLACVVPAHGGWSALFDAAAYEVDTAQVSRRLVEHEVAATAMTASGGTPTLAVRAALFPFPAVSCTSIAGRGEHLSGVAEGHFHRISQSANGRPGHNMKHRTACNPELGGVVRWCSVRRP